MSRNLSNCNANSLAETDLPAGWESNGTSLCGISWPSETPWTNLSSCCVSYVQVLNGCFHWCEPIDRDRFSGCAYDAIQNVSIGMAPCNHNLAGRTAVPGGLAASALMLWVLLHSML